MNGTKRTALVRKIQELQDSAGYVHSTVRRARNEERGAVEQAALADIEVELAVVLERLHLVRSRCADL